GFSSTAIIAAATTRTRAVSRKRCSTTCSTRRRAIWPLPDERSTAPVQGDDSGGVGARARGDVRRARATEVAAASSRRLPHVRRQRRGALRRQGARPQEARVELFSE